MPERVRAAPAAVHAGLPAEGRVRAVVESVAPCVDGGRFPIKRVVGESVRVEADCFADGHDRLACVLRWRHEQDPQWRETPMAPLANDRWRASFVVDRLGGYRYTVCAWVDPFLSWRHDLARRVDAEDILVAARVGAELIGRTAGRARGADRAALSAWARKLGAATPVDEIRDLAADEALGALALRHADRALACTWPVELGVVVEPERARVGAWYELFPRSASAVPGAHGTFADCEARLAYVAGMGFDVVYLPPIHPIGRARRKGPNNTLEPGPEDVGSPWAIGSAEGGHEAIHPQLGTREDFRRLVTRARELGMEIALDIAWQCAPDHPWVAEHPEWFRHRPDGSVQYAENPPKKYQDIYPFDFESPDWQGLWRALEAVLEHWIAEGVRIFRVDNPHTKAFPFWEWVIGQVKSRHPETIFLSEAFTRPRVMHRLAKLGFSQSYTYFAWRNTRKEITDYFTELCQGPGREYFRPNLWPNTPDILTEYLQVGGRPAFMTRLVLAATLAASYGIYGPAFELMEHAPREPGSEEYLDSEKYQLRHWDVDREDSLRDFVGRVNRARRENPALHADWSLRFHSVDNEQLMVYSKSTPELDNVVLVAVNLDPYHAQAGWVDLDLDVLGLDPAAPYQMHELLSGARFLWSGPRNFVRLDPAQVPAHVFRLRRRVKTERDFDYFM